MPFQILFSHTLIAKEYRAACHKHAIRHYEIWAGIDTDHIWEQRGGFPDCDDEHLVIELHLELAYVCHAYEGAGHRKYHREYITPDGKLLDDYLGEHIGKYDKVKHLAIETSIKPVGDSPPEVDFDSCIAAEEQTELILMGRLMELPSLVTWSVRWGLDDGHRISWAGKKGAGEEDEEWNIMEEPVPNGPREEQDVAYAEFLGMMGLPVRRLEVEPPAAPATSPAPPASPAPEQSAIADPNEHLPSRIIEHLTTDTRSRDDSSSEGAEDETESDAAQPPAQTNEWSTDVEKIQPDQPWHKYDAWVGLPLSRQGTANEAGMIHVGDVTVEQQNYEYKEKTTNRERRGDIRKENELVFLHRMAEQRTWAEMVQWWRGVLEEMGIQQVFPGQANISNTQHVSSGDGHASARVPVHLPPAASGVAIPQYQSTVVPSQQAGMGLPARKADFSFGPSSTTLGQLIFSHQASALSISASNPSSTAPGTSSPFPPTTTHPDTSNSPAATWTEAGFAEIRAPNVPARVQGQILKGELIKHRPVSALLKPDPSGPRPVILGDDWDMALEAEVEEEEH